MAELLAEDIQWLKTFKSRQYFWLPSHNLIKAELQIIYNPIFAPPEWQGYNACFVYSTLKKQFFLPYPLLLLDASLCAMGPLKQLLFSALSVNHTLMT